jgi:hypothetical protein
MTASPFGARGANRDAAHLAAIALQWDQSRWGSAAPAHYHHRIDANQRSEGQMMVLWSFVSQSATLASRPRVLTTTFMCALSAAVRFASTVDEGTRMPAHPPHAQNAIAPIMTKDGVPIFCLGWGPKPAQPLALPRPRGCRAWPL